MEKLIHLFNTLWFERVVLSESPVASTLPESSTAELELDRRGLKISHVRSSSDQLILSSNINLLSDAESPKSVLYPTPKLETILSGKEVGVGFGELEAGEDKAVKIPKAVGKRRGRGRGRRSKSLTELEFEEVKGFMDLGFVFSEEDHNDSNLVSIIPGLQRLGDRGCVKGEDDDDYQSGVVSRPYLSEAWRCERNQRKHLRVKLRVSSELEMKNQIKFWAHSVASAVK
ncbi:hypothetical protein QQ045_020015 [Rhodiola kirilowii]